jgi:hypothetical protein
MNRLHRLFNQHVWKTIRETRVEGLSEKGLAGLEYKGTEDPVSVIRRLREGYYIINQECTICGDRRTIRK